MATRALDIVVRGKDQASGIFGKVGAGLRGLASTAFSMKGAIAAAIGGYGLKSAVDHAMTVWGEQEQAMAKLRGTLNATGGAAGFTAEQLMEYAGALQKSTTFGDEAIINGEAILATFKNIRGDVFKEATGAMLDMTAVMGGEDLKGAAIQLGKALNDPIRGMAALAEVGVTFDESQRQAITGFQKSGQLAKAQAVILRELKSEFGGVSQAMAKTGTGSMAQFRNAVRGVWEDVGKALTPAIALLAQTVSEAGPSISSIFEKVGNNVATACDYVRVAISDWEGSMRTATAFSIVMGDTVTRELRRIQRGTVDDLSSWTAKVWTIFKEVLGPARTLEEIVANSAMAFRIIDESRRDVTGDLLTSAEVANLNAFEEALAHSKERFKLDLNKDFERFKMDAKTLALPAGLASGTSAAGKGAMPKTTNETYASRMMRYAPGQMIERGYTVKVAPDPKIREIADSTKKATILLSRLITATEAPTQIDTEVFEP